MAFLEDLKNRVLVADGAMGTLLYTYGIGLCVEETNLLDPEKVKKIHDAYIQAGAKVIQTNTFSANRIKLERYGLQNKVTEINIAAVKIAKQAAQSNAYVLGTIGGIRGARKDIPEDHELEVSLKEQLSALLTEDVDGILLETFFDLQELMNTLKFVRNQTSLPIIAQLTISEFGFTQNGKPLNEAFNRLESLGADVVGLNCRFGPHHMVLAYEKIALPKKAFLSVYPNASLPDMVDGQFVYSSQTEYFAEKALELYHLGARLIGGCCGTTPAHIKAVSDKLNNLRPVTVKDFKEPIKPVVIKDRQPAPYLHEVVKKRRSVIVELDPPRHLDTKEFIEGAKALKAAGVDAITMADNSLATAQVSNLAMGAILKQQIDVQPLIHITCRDRNLIGLQSHLMGMHALGLHEVLAVTGDPTKTGDLPGASSVFDVASFDLIKLIRQMNEGISFSGKNLRKSTSFSIAAALNPNVHNLDIAIKRMEKKIAEGADYFITQPLYSEEQILSLHQATKHLDKPIYIGIMPLTSSRNAEFLHNEVPGIKLSPQILNTMAKCANDPIKSQSEGLEIAKNLIDAALQLFKGIYLITPFMRYELSLILADYISSKNI